MEKSVLITGIFLLSILALSGCAKQQLMYVCPDGVAVSDASYCLRQAPVQAAPAQNQQTALKVCKTTHIDGGRFSGMYDIPEGMSFWVENLCGYEINGVYDESTTKVSSRYCDGNDLMDTYFTCENNECVGQSRRFSCADLATNSVCVDNHLDRPECLNVVTN